MEVLIAWIVCSAASATLGKSKGRNVVAWALIGLVLGPIGLLISALVKPLAGANPDYHL